MATALAYLSHKDDYLYQTPPAAFGAVDALYPVSNLVSLPVSQPTRFPGYGAKIYADLGVAKVVNLIALIAHNLSSSATITVSAGLTVACANYSTTIQWRDRTAFLYLDNAQQHRYWLITISDNANLDGQIDVGRLMIGNATVIPRVSWGWTRQIRHINAGTIGEFGTENIERLYATTKLALPFKNFASSEIDVLRNMVHAAEGNYVPGFFIPDVTGTEGYFGRFESDPIETMSVRRSTSLEFVESSPGRSIKEPQLFVWKHGMNFSTAAGASVTYTRNSTATRINSLGQVQSLTANECRHQHYPNVPNACTLLEFAMTNLIGAWSAYQGTLGANAAAAPDGTVTATKAKEDTTTNQHGAIQSVPGLADNTYYAYSAFAKAAERTFCYLQTGSKDASSRLSWFNLTTGQWGTCQHTYVKATPLANGWYRLEVNFNSMAGGNTPYVMVGTAIADAVASHQGGLDAGVYFAMAQLEGGCVMATSYHASTRVQDLLHIPFTLIPQQSSFYLKFIESGSIYLGNNPVLINLGGDAAPCLHIYNNGGKYRIMHYNGSGSVYSELALAPVAGDLVELRGHLYSDGSVQLFQSINGQSEASAVKSGALALAGAWATQDMHINSTHTTCVGSQSYQAVKVLRGIQPLSVCRAA